MRNESRAFHVLSRACLLAGLALPSILVTAQPIDTGGLASDVTVVNRATRLPESLYDFAGKIIVLDFFAYWCGPCQTSSPALERDVQGYYAARGGNPSRIPVQVIGVNVEPANPALTDQFIASANIGLVLDDLQFRIYQQFLVGQSAIPRFVIINGAAHSTSHRRWEVVKNTLGWGGGNTAANFRQVIDSVIANPAVLAIAAHPRSRQIDVGASAALSVAAAGSDVTYQWTMNGATVPGASGATLALDAVGPANAGIYHAIAANSTGTIASEPAVLGLTTTSKVVGTGSEVAPNVLHPNGNTFDQILVQGPAASITADTALNQITRLSFADKTHDLLQVEFSGAGTLTIVLDEATAPAPPVNYHQPGVNYVTGHAGIVITGANETTNVSVFSIGRGNAVNQALFKDGVAYDGMADLAFIAIQSVDGKFGGLRAANASFWATQGFTGVYAPGVQFIGPVYVHDINAQQDATPVLMLGSALGNTWITGGDLEQANGRAVRVSGLTQLKMADGTSSHYVATSPSSTQYFVAKTNQARLERDGVDVTTQIVVNP